MSCIPLRRFFLSLLLAACCFLLLASPARAGLNDDNFDGNIFALYGGNGSLIPPKTTLAQSFQREKPALLVLYLEDSKDCKQYAVVVSQLQPFYGRAADIIPINADSLADESNSNPSSPSYYYQGFVPQTLIFDQSGQVIFNEVGNIPFERVDDAFREVFNLLPREESVKLKSRPVNEINAEIAQ